MENLEDFFKKRGIKKKVTEFDKSQESEIQSVLETIIKPVFNELANEFSSYSNVKADYMTSKSAIDAVMENIEFRVYKMTLLKFSYKPKFISGDDGISIIGQFSIPDFYGDKKTYQNTELRKLLSDLDEEDIKNDVTNSFIANSKLDQKNTVANK